MASGPKKIRILSSSGQEQTLLRNIPLGDIQPSTTNRAIDETSPTFLELVASVTKWGVVQPVTVRRIAGPDGDASRYEIIAGERRYRASIAAGRPTIPAVVRPDVADDAALSLQLTENLHREDLDPIVFAERLQLLRDMGKSVEEIAELIGRPAKRVYDTLKQLDLIEPARTAYRMGLFSQGHAILLARLTPALQEKALLAILDHAQYGWPGAVSLLSTNLPSFDDLISRAAANEAFTPMPEKALRGWINGTVNLKLSSAPWDLADAALLPEAGACESCPKRSTNNPDLYADLVAGKRDVCMDPACWAAKSAAFIQIQTQQAEQKGTRLVELTENNEWKPADDGATRFASGQWVKAEPGSCPDVVQGIFTSGSNAGERKHVCCNARCEVHEHSHFYIKRTEEELAELELAQAAVQQRYAEEAAQREKERERQVAWFRSIGTSVIAMDDTTLTALVRLFVRQLESFGDSDVLDLLATVHAWELPEPGDEDYLDALLAKVHALDPAQKRVLLLQIALAPFLDLPDVLRDDVPFLTPELS